MYNLTCDTVCNLFRKRSNVHNILTRHAPVSFYVLPCRTELRRDFIVNRGSVSWNSLSSNFRLCNRLIFFKQLVKNMIFVKYI